MRVQQPKEYKNGKDVSTLSFRHRTFMETASVPKIMQAYLLLDSIDETQKKLASRVSSLRSSWIARKKT